MQSMCVCGWVFVQGKGLICTRPTLPLFGTVESVCEVRDCRVIYPRSADRPYTRMHTQPGSGPRPPPAYLIEKRFCNITPPPKPDHLGREKRRRRSIGLCGLRQVLPLSLALSLSPFTMLVGGWQARMARRELAEHINISSNQKGSSINFNSMFR